MQPKLILTLAFAVALILAFPFLVRFVEGEDRDAQTQPQAVAQEPQPIAPEPEANRAAFQQVRLGMTYAQCVELIGVEGKRRSGAGPGQVRYRWSFPDGTFQELLFANDRLIGGGHGRERAEQVPIDMDRVREMEKEAIEARLPVPMTVEEYEQLRTGMTYRECVAVVGDEGTLFQFGGPGGPAVTQGRETYVWQNPGYTAFLTFVQGRLSEGAWYGKPRS